MSTVQSGKLISGGIAFVSEDCNDTEFFFFGSNENEGTKTVDFDIMFQDGAYQNRTGVNAQFSAEALQPAFPLRPTMGEARERHGAEAGWSEAGWAEQDGAALRIKGKIEIWEEQFWGRI